MDKKELVKDLKDYKAKVSYIEDLLKEIDQEPAVQFIINCVRGCIIHIDKTHVAFPNSVFYMKEGKVLFEIVEGTLIVNDDKVWKVLMQQYGLSYHDTQDLVKKVATQHFRWPILTPVHSAYFREYRWKDIDIN